MRHSISIIGLCISLVSVTVAKAQSSNQKSDELYNKIAELDSVLFANVYTCNTAKNETFFTDDLEFYHDKGGVTKSRKSLIEELKNNFCGEEKPKLRRELVKGSLKVCAISNYGAVEMGEHRFYVTEKGQPEKLTGVAMFTHIWKFENGEWRISRVLSYDHKEPDSKAPAATKELYDTIARMDSMMFGAFNAHDPEKLMALFTDDLEFYHDKDGLGDYRQTKKNFQSLFAQNNGIRRELIQGSFEVYPIKDYGAIEIGAHQFCHIENAKEDCGTFPFIMLWQKKDGEWKVSRVISYNH